MDGKEADVLELMVVEFKRTAGDLHQEEMDGLVDALAVLGEEVVDRSDRGQDAHLKPCLLPDLAQRRLLHRLCTVRCPLGQHPGDAASLAAAHTDAQLRFLTDVYG